MRSVRFVPPLLFLLLQSAIAQAPDDPAKADTVSWTVHSQDILGKSGHATLTVQAAIKPGWHVYALKQLPQGPTPLLVTVAANDVAAASGAPVGSPPTKIHDPAFDLDTQFYSGDFTLTVPVRIKPHVVAGPQAIPVDVRFQTCNGRVCQPPKTVRLSAPVTLAER